MLFFHIIESLYIINFRISIGEIKYGKIIIYCKIIIHIEIRHNVIYGIHNQGWELYDQKYDKNMTKI